MYDPTLSEAYAALGLAYLHKKSHEEAATASKKAIELDPNNFLGYWILGRIYHTTDRDREAVDLFLKVITLNPDFYSGYGDLRMAYESLGEKAKGLELHKSEIQVYPRYLAKHPDDARAHMFYALSLIKDGKMEDARAEGARAIELSPDDSLMLYNASCFYASLGDKVLAVETLRKAIAAGYEFYEWIKRDSDLEPIRNEPGYLEIMRGK
jgi:tetratricopeptide (TPR) repeat protein